MTITRELKEEVIRLSNEGKGRNEIARFLSGQISEGSVGNIIRATRRQTRHDRYDAYKRASTDVNIWEPQPQGSSSDKKTLSQQQDTPDDNVIPMTSPTMTGKAVISDSFITPTDGGPLSWLPEEATITDIWSPSSAATPGINNDISDIHNNEQNEASQNQTEEDGQPVFSLPTVEDQGPSVRTKLLSNSEDSPRADLGFPDWDSEEAWQRRFMRYVFDDKRQRSQQLQLIENGRRELEEERQRLTQMAMTIDERNNDLRRREDEIRPLLPNIRELQFNGITFDILMAFMMAVNEKSALENIDLKTAAWNMVKDFREYRNLGGLRRVIEHAERKLESLGPEIRQNEFAVTILIHLKQAGYTEKQIMDLASVIRNWNAGSHINGRSKILDSELIDVDHQQQHPEEPNNNNPQQPLRQSELVGLQLLRANAANMLNKIGRTG